MAILTARSWDVVVNFKELIKKNKTIIYKESESNKSEEDWELWGERITETEHVFVFRKIVTLEEAEQYELENELLK